MNTELTRRGALMGVTSLAACMREDDANTIRFWAMGNEAARVPEVFGPFQARTGLSVRVQALPWTAAHERLLTAYAGNALPDVAQVGNTWVSEMTAIGALRPVDADEQLDDNFPGVLDTNRIGERYYALPWYVDTRLLFYRTDMLARAGYETVPHDWTAWKASMHAVKRIAGEGNFAILLPLNEFEQLLTLGLQQEEPLLREEGSRGNFSNPGFVAALEFYKSLFDEGLAPIASATQISNVWNEFSRGFFSYYFSGPWSIGDFQRRLAPEYQDKWATAEMPGPRGLGASAPGGSSLVVFKDARSPEAAWALVRHLLDPETQVQFHAITGDLPACVSAWRAPALANDPYVATFGRQLQRAKPVPKVPEWERIVTEMQVVAERMVRGEYQPAAAAREIDRRADALLEKRRWMLERGRAI